jgi:hypothetical protein
MATGDAGASRPLLRFLGFLFSLPSTPVGGTGLRRASHIRGATACHAASLHDALGCNSNLAERVAYPRALAIMAGLLTGDNGAMSILVAVTSSIGRASALGFAYLSRGR